MILSKIGLKKILKKIFYKENKNKQINPNPCNISIRHHIHLDESNNLYSNLFRNIGGNLSEISSEIEETKKIEDIEIALFDKYIEIINKTIKSFSCTKEDKDGILIIAENNFDPINLIDNELPKSTIYYLTNLENSYNDVLQEKYKEEIESGKIVLKFDRTIINVKKVYSRSSIFALDYIFLNIPIITPDNSIISKLLSVKYQKCTLFWYLYVRGTKINCPLTNLTVGIEEAIFYTILKTIPCIRNIIFNKSKRISKTDEYIAFSNDYNLEIFDVLNNLKNDFFIENLKKSIVGKIYSDFIERNTFDESYVSEIVQLCRIEKANNLYCLIFLMLFKTGKLDDIQKFFNSYGKFFNINQYTFTKQDLYQFFCIYISFYYKLYGRPVEILPIISETIITTSFDENYFLLYIEILSENCNLNIIEKLIKNYILDKKNYKLLEKCVTIINRNVQGDQYPQMRYKICRWLAKEAYNLKNNRSTYKWHVNQLRYFYLMRNTYALLKTAEKLKNLFFYNFTLEEYGVLSNCIHRIIYFRRFSLALALINKFFKTNNITRYSLLSNLLTKQEDTKKFFKFYETIPKKLQNNFKLLQYYRQNLVLDCNFEEALDVYHNDSRVVPLNLQLFKSAISDYDAIKQLSELNKIYKSVPQPQFPKSVIFFASGSEYYGRLLLPLSMPFLIELKRMGVAVISLTKGILKMQETGDDVLDSFYGILPKSMFDGTFDSKWEIHLEKKIFKKGNINYYQGLHESVSMTTRSYNVDLDNMYSKYIIDIAKLQADSVVKCCNKIVDLLCPRGFDVYFLNCIHNVIPFSIFRDFCINTKRVQHIYITIGNDIYFYGRDLLYSKTITAHNMTKNPTCRASHLGTKSEFDSWYHQIKNNKTIKDKIKNEFLNFKNDNSLMSNQGTLEKIKNAKNHGKKIICCFGRLLTDICYPQEGGKAHSDMNDWVNDSILTCSNNDNCLLLLKPHPIEVVPRLSRRLTEFFKDLIITPLPKNVILLGHNELTSEDLYSILDLGLTWAGSVATELYLHNIPCVVCSTWGVNDNLFQVLQPESLDDYHNMLMNPDHYQVSEEQRFKAAAALYFRKYCVAKDFIYASVSNTNDLVGCPKINMKAFLDLLHKGDSDIYYMSKGLL